MFHRSAAAAVAPHNLHKQRKILKLKLLYICTSYVIYLQLTVRQLKQEFTHFYSNSGNVNIINQWKCVKEGLRLNAKKIEVITYNIRPPDHLPLMIIRGTALKEVSDFKYMGAWVECQSRT